MQIKEFVEKVADGNFNQSDVINSAREFLNRWNVDNESVSELNDLIIIGNSNGNYDVFIDGGPFPITEIEINFKKHPPVMNLGFHLKKCELDVQGKIQFNGNIISQRIAREIYDQLKAYFAMVDNPEGFQDEVNNS